MLEKFRSISMVSQFLIILTCFLLVYGYLCRLIGLYFFWESNVISWSLLFITIIFLLRDRLLSKKAKGKETVSERVGIGLMIFILSVQIVMLFVIPQMDSYKVARNYLQSEKLVSEQVGGVTSIVLLPVGSFKSTTTSEGEFGQADLNFIVKGNAKFKDYSIHLIKEEKSDWKIVNAQ